MFLNELKLIPYAWNFNCSNTAEFPPGVSFQDNSRTRQPSKYNNCQKPAILFTIQDQADSCLGPGNCLLIQY